MDQQPDPAKPESSHFSKVLSSTKKFILHIKKYLLVAEYYLQKGFYFLRDKSKGLRQVFINSHPSSRGSKDINHLLASFTGETIIAGIALLTIVLNLWFFGFATSKGESTYADNSVAAKLLSMAPSLNQKLSNKNNTVKVTVESPKIFAQAFADDFQPLAESLAFTSEGVVEDKENVLIEDDMLVKGQKVSTRDLVEIYETQGGDTLASVAKRFNLSINTIKWSNDLTSDQIKPGWYLQIPPADGVLYEAKVGDTASSIAKKLSGDTESLLSYNSLSSGDDIEPGDLLMCVNCRLPDTIKPKPSPKTTALSEPKEARYFGKRSRFAAGQCTDYVARVFEMMGKRIMWRGNANQWHVNAIPYGASVDRIPTPGAIVQTSDNSRYGHVAYVESVTSTTVTFSEWNYKGKYIKSTRTLPLTSKKILRYIHY